MPTLTPAKNADNIIIGASSVYYSLDSFTTATDIGYTMNGQTIRYKPEFVNVVADQANGVVRKGRSEERMFLKFTMLEVTLEQLRIAMMFKTGSLITSAKTLTLGENDSCYVSEVGFIIVGPGVKASGVCGTRTWTFGKCVIDDTERMYETKRDQAVQFEMSFEILKDTNGHFGTAVDT